MAKADVNGHVMSYDVEGEGPNITFMPGGFRAREMARPVAHELVTAGHKVMIHDRANTGESAFILEGDSLFDVWIRQLHRLLEHLDMLPVYVGGASGGTMGALRFALQYPDSVKGLLATMPVADDAEAFQKLVETIFLEPSRLAEELGMDAVIEHGGGWFNWADQAGKDPAKREQLLSTDPKQFAARMRQWAEDLKPGRGYLAGLSKDQISQISCPAIVISGWDKTHTPEAAKGLHELLPNSKLIIPEEYFDNEEWERIMKLVQEKGGIYFTASLAPLLVSFIKELEK